VKGLCFTAGGVTTTAAAKTTAEVADPPSRLVTTRLTAEVPAAPKVHDTVIDVADTTVAEPQVPPEESATVAPVRKPVPVMVKAFVEAGVAVTGETAVIVGAG
jgi:hypothetical protein